MTSDQTPTDHDHDPAAPCPRCRALEERVAELERRLAGQGGASEAADAGPRVVKALRLIEHGWGKGWGLRPSPPRRQWMDEAPGSYLCLPMVIANQWGWQVLCPTDVRAAWDGSPGPEGVRVEVDPAFAPAVKSRFGSGIVTFSPPWLFRTPPGWDLYVKGPGNRWKPNGAPLEGVVETWWLNYTFTLNWKIVAPGELTFSKGESLAQLVPVPHTTFDGCTAVEAPILHAEPAAGATLLDWLAERRRITPAPVNVHHRYRKAEDVVGHLRRVPVPPFGPGAGAEGKEEERERG